AFPAYYAITAPPTGTPPPYNVSITNTWDQLGKVCLTTNPVAYTLSDGQTVVNTSTNIDIYSYTPGVAGNPAAFSGTTTGPANGYLAQASGVISSNADRASTTAGDYDQWTIDHERTLRNTHDGVK